MMTEQIDWGKPVRTVKDKTPVEILTTKGRSFNSPIIGYLGREIKLYYWRDTGEYWQNSAHFLDLENVPEKKVVYLNIYKHDVSEYSSREAADHGHAKGRLACVRLEYEEGQFDE